MLVTFYVLADDILELFFFFFQENSLSLFKQIGSNGDNLHEVSNPVFWGNIINLSSAELAKKRVKVNVILIETDNWRVVYIN